MWSRQRELKDSHRLNDAQAFAEYLENKLLQEVIWPSSAGPPLSFSECREGHCETKDANRENRILSDAGSLLDASMSRLVMVGERKREIYGYISSSIVVQVNLWSRGNSPVLPRAAQANDRKMLQSSL